MALPAGSTTSGTSDFFLSCGNALIEAFERIELRPPEITGQHMISGRNSLNLELQSWNNFVPLLWKIDTTPTMIPLLPGVSVYSLPTDTVTMLDTYLRTFQLPNQFNVPPNFTTTAGNNIVTGVIANNGMLPGYWFQLVTPIAIDGIVLYGFYQVIDIIDQNTFTFQAAANALVGVANGGALPLFTTSVPSSQVQVTLANHGYTAAGQTFNIPPASQVDGINLQGAYNIVSIVDVNNFIIQTYTPASSLAVAYENNAMAQFQVQSNTVDPIDRILTPIGRTDYSEFPDKFRQTIPTQYLFLRNVNPTVTLYQTPNSFQPYVLMTYLMRRIQNANPSMNEIPDIHFLFQDALCAKLAVRLAVKYAKTMLPVLKEEAKEAWEAAITENRERAEDYIIPQLSPYWNIT
jgi:hypothetical protein